MMRLTLIMMMYRREMEEEHAEEVEIVHKLLSFLCNNLRMVNDSEGYMDTNFYDGEKSLMPTCETPECFNRSETKIYITF